MLALLRHRRLHTLHLWMLVLVGVGVFCTSLASVLTDIHMLSHADGSADVHGHDDARLALAPDAEDSANALLHALVHCVDCHGHGGVLPVVPPSWRMLAAAAQPALPAWVDPLAVQPAESLFRPPIAV